MDAEIVRLKKNIVEAIASIGVGHIGGCLSIADVLAVLYGKHMRYDPKNPKMAGRDRLICSKGHAGPAIYAALAEVGFFPKEELKTLNKGGTRLPSKLSKDGATIYAIIGDGESQEGQIWEAAMYAGSHHLDNLIVFTDYNKMQLDGTTAEINDLEPLADKWRAFNFAVWDIPGNDVEAIDAAVTAAKALTGKPKMIILNTVKGKGVSFVEAAKVGSHSMNISADDRDKAIKELEGECRNGD